MILAIVAAGGIWYLRQWDIARRAIVVFYEITDEHATAFQALMDGVAHLQSAVTKNQLVAEAKTTSASAKTSAGATSIGKTAPASLGLQAPPGRALRSPRDRLSLGKYINKSGGPNRRFKDNRELPVILTREFHVWSGNGLDARFQFSNPHAATFFVEALTMVKSHALSTDVLPEPATPTG